MFNHVTKRTEIPKVVEYDPWDGYFGKQFIDSLNGMIYKVKYFLAHNPGKVFGAGVVVGTGMGFFLGFQTGLLAGVRLLK
jgi:hypothetical protein